ncbi:MAG: glycosyltransferase family 4 protein [Acidimicrobiales bacterium]|nr:glycosyltransferase family 4 protein [Acidimicrobiales bacterium]
MSEGAGAIHQLIPSLAQRDAVGTHTLLVQSLLRQLGYRSELYAEEVKPEMTGLALPLRRFPRRRTSGTILLYQASIGSPVASFLAGRPEPKLVNYHNVTPYGLAEGFDLPVAAMTALGRHQLKRLAPLSDAGIAVSRFNQQDLLEAGFRRTFVAPPLVDLRAFDVEVDHELLERLGERKTSAGGSDWLFVGRISPHKAQHDLVKALAAYRQAYDPNARLHLVGSAQPALYRDTVARLAMELGLGDAVDLAGSISPGALAAHYRNADVFVCASDHEGFNVPLLEAMYHGVPVVAHAAAAVPETLGEAGLLLEGPKSALRMAAAVHLVLADPALRSRLAAAGSRRLEQLAPERTKARFARVIEEAIGAADRGPGDTAL